MREPIYRGRRSDTGETVEGYLVRAEGQINGGKCYIIPKITGVAYTGIESRLYTLSGFYEVNPESVEEIEGTGKGCVEKRLR